LTYNHPVLTFIETRLFTRLADDYLGADGLFALQLHLLQHPDSGAIIQGSGGVRKLRWARPGTGKRGGLRIIYYLRTEQGQVWLLTLYAKNVRDSIPGHVLKRIKEEIDEEG
jgi:hypothetical protein